MLPIDPEILRVAHSLRELQLKTNVEHLHAIAADGVVYRAAGNSISVTAPPELEMRYDEPGADIVYHHSHPDDRALSPTDLALIARPGVRTIWAHAPSGASYGAALRAGIDKREYDQTLIELQAYLHPDIIEYDHQPLGVSSFEAFRDFSVMLVLERLGWIDCHLAWSDETRRSIFQEMSGFFQLTDYLARVTSPRK